jgi:hypothetical protein
MRPRNRAGPAGQADPNTHNDLTWTVEDAAIGRGWRHLTGWTAWTAQFI